MCVCERVYAMPPSGVLTCFKLVVPHGVKGHICLLLHQWEWRHEERERQKHKISHTHTHTDSGDVCLLLSQHLVFQIMATHTKMSAATYRSHIRCFFCVLLTYTQTYFNSDIECGSHISRISKSSPVLLCYSNNSNCCKRSGFWHRQLESEAPIYSSWQALLCLFICWRVLGKGSVLYILNKGYNMKAQMYAEKKW